MRYLVEYLCVCALGLMPLVGCSGTSDDDGGTGGTAGTGGSAGTGGTAGTGGSAGTGGTGGEVRQYQIRFLEFDSEGVGSSSEGVEFCQADTENCDTSDASGIVTLNVPEAQEITFTMEKKGYGKWVVGDVSDDTYESFATRPMYTDAQLEAIAAQLDTTYPWTDGIVGLVRWPSDHAGVTFIPVGSTGDAVGDPFYYDAATREYSLDLDATTSVADSHLLPLGSGGFTEVTPGVQEFEFGGTSGDCRATWAWPGDGPNKIRVPVREGYRTYGSMRCDGL